MPVKMAFWPPGKNPGYARTVDSVINGSYRQRYYKHYSQFYMFLFYRYFPFYHVFPPPPTKNYCTPPFVPGVRP